MAIELTNLRAEAAKFAIERKFLKEKAD